MCGDNEKDLYDPRRFGALAILKAGAASEIDMGSEDLSGQIVFFNDADRESHMATHVRFTPDAPLPPCDDLALTIFSTGNLALPSAECEQLEKIVLPRHCTSRFNLRDQESLQFELRQGLHLSVGGCGIIGRRVTIQSLGLSKRYAEGIVGFNTGINVRSPS